MLFLNNSVGVVIFIVINGAFLVGKLFVGLNGRVVLVFDLNSQALAAKLYWRWCSRQHKLWAQIITHKYFYGTDPCYISALPLQVCGSMVWHTLKIGAVLVKRGLF